MDCCADAGSDAPAADCLSIMQRLRDCGGGEYRRSCLDAAGGGGPPPPDAHDVAAATAWKRERVGAARGVLGRGGGAGAWRAYARACWTCVRARGAGAAVACGRGWGRGDGVVTTVRPPRPCAQMRTAAVGVFLCLNPGIDPPDAVRVPPCARKEAWTPPWEFATRRAAEAVVRGTAPPATAPSEWHPRAGGCEAAGTVRADSELTIQPTAVQGAD